MAADNNFKTPRRQALIGAALALVGLAGAARATPDYSLADFAIVDRDTGQELRTWRHHGRLFVAGEPGARYAVRLVNHTDGRLLLVVSVDGVNILSGETAGFDRGYVLSPHETADITGWRKSTSEVAAFTFAPLSQSYAARTGRPNDVGVIGMAVFTERPAPPPTYSYTPLQRRSALTAGLAAPRSAPSAPAPPPPSPVMAPASRAAAAPYAAMQRPVAAPVYQSEEKLGTGHGAREISYSSVTSFDRATSYPVGVQQIEYDTYANLVMSGVIPRGNGGQRHPDPFPASDDRSGYVPDPPE